MLFSLQVFVWKIIELHDKYVAHVTDCFRGHTLFHKVCWLMQSYAIYLYTKLLLPHSQTSLCLGTKKPFEVFCNKGVSGSSSAELLATFCDNILKKGCSEKLSDEAIEDALEKVKYCLSVY